MGMRAAAILAGVLTIASVGSASAYEVIDVVEGGVIEGRVTLHGPVPEAKGFNLIIYPDPQYCGRISNGSGWRLLRDFSVDSTGGLQDAVVILEGIEAGKPFDISVPLIEARDCRFQPFVTIVRDGHAVEVVNMDPVMHDIQAYETSSLLGPRVLFNSPLPMNVAHKRGDLHATHDHPPGKSKLGPIYLSKGRRMFMMQCGFHPYMESWAMAVPTPYYAITDAAGRFTMDRVPPGTYRLAAWHPQTAEVTSGLVTIAPHGRATVELALEAPQGRRTAHQVMDNPRFGPGVLGYPLDIVPLVEHQR